MRKTSTPENLHKSKKQYSISNLFRFRHWHFSFPRLNAYYWQKNFRIFSTHQNFQVLYSSLQQSQMEDLLHKGFFHGWKQTRKMIVEHLSFLANRSLYIFFENFIHFYKDNEMKIIPYFTQSCCFSLSQSELDITFITTRSCLFFKPYNAVVNITKTSSLWWINCKKKSNQ